MNREPVYEERVSSRKTEWVWIGLTALFVALLGMRVAWSGFGYLAAVFLLFACFFLFYAFNYRFLIIRVTPKTLALRFGVFSWIVPWETVAGSHLDETSMWRIGGAGIHFTRIRGRYRVYLNFLEYPRIVLQLRRPRGLVRDVAFSTRRSAELLSIIAARSRTGNGVTGSSENHDAV